MSGDSTITMVAKYGKRKISLSSLPSSSTIAHIKSLLHQQTGILPKRQKLIGLKSTSGTSVTDEMTLSELRMKKDGNNEKVECQFILMGTPEENIFVDPGEKDDLPDVVDDFDSDFNAGSDEVSASVLA
jgi:ubiquitin-like domain-containing CTD phosphatase 1